jgi:hypothetical protein
MTTRRASTIAAVAALALGLGACGDDETTVTETDAAPVTTTAATSTTAPTSTTATTTSTTATTSTSGSTTTSPAANCDFNNGEIYSQASGGCVQQRSGNNPCPAGEVPMADQAVCTKEN